MTSIAAHQTWTIETGSVIRPHAKIKNVVIR
jgi:hypothetical protein